MNQLFQDRRRKDMAKPLALPKGAPFYPQRPLPERSLETFNKDPYFLRPASGIQDLRRKKPVDQAGSQNEPVGSVNWNI
jgi:hypothetical protein